MKQRILTFIDAYLPGYQAGGPIRSLSNLIERFGNDFEFLVVTLDRDLHDDTAYPGISIGRWTKVGLASVLYLAPPERSVSRLYEVMHEVKYDAVLLSSYFSKTTVTILCLRYLGLVPQVPLSVFTNGEFSQGALSIKRTKKKLYLALACTCRIHRGILWKASSQFEKEDVIRTLSYNSAFRFLRVAATPPTILIAPNLPQASAWVADSVKPEKNSGHVKMAFVSRVSRMKNLDGAIQILSRVTTSVVFDIYGPIEDTAYWTECQALMELLPTNVHVTYKGALPHEHIAATLAEYHLLFLPTLGENFGHVIIEALQQGCLTLISDRTPWRNLRKECVGWDLPLEDQSAFVSAIHEAAEMNELEFALWSNAARSYAETSEFLASSTNATREFLLRLCEHS